MPERYYYYDTEANDDKSIRREAIAFANTIAEKDSSIKRIVLYLGTKNNTTWFEKLFSKAVIMKLFNDEGYRFPSIKVPVKIETIATYKRSYQSDDIVICYGTRSKGLYDLEDNNSVRYMISIPWRKIDTEEWIKSRNAINAQTGEACPIALPTPVVIVALTDLTNRINLNTGIIDPTDNELAKTYIRTLYQNESSLDGVIVSAYLVNYLKWETKHAQEVRHLIDQLNEGKTFKGGTKTGLKRIYRSWQEIADKQKTKDLEQLSPEE